MRREAAAPTVSLLGAQIRHRRWDELRVLQATLAAAVGISQAQLCEIERGTAGTTEGTLWKLADALELDFAELRAQAEREGRLARNRDGLHPSPEPGNRPAERPHLARLPEPPPRPRLGKARRWLTTGEAAQILGRTSSQVAYLIRVGRLRPAVKESKGRGHQRRWLVAASAVVRYDPPAYWDRRGKPGDPPPPGHLAVDEFARAVGIPTATLYRRIAEWGLKSVKDGHRRWIPEDQLAVFQERQGGEGPP